MLSCWSGWLNASAALARAPQASNPAGSAMQLPATVAKQSKASRDDSLAAEKKAWFALRDMSWRTGTKAFKMRKAAEGRTGIIDALKIVPGDDWLNNFRLRYPVPGAPAAFTPAARAACGTSPWWCDLLFALSVYRTGNFEKADSVLSAGLASMPDHVRCVWGDVASLIPEKKARTAYEHMPCAERFVFEDNLWWLTDPLHTRAGNERRLEHLAREINMRLSQEQSMVGTPGPQWALFVLRHGTLALNGVDISPDPDSSGDGNEMTHRKWEGFLNRVDDSYGRANPLAYRTSLYSFWEIQDRLLRLGPVGGAPANTPRVTYAFVPVMAALDDPMRAESSHWQLDKRVNLEFAVSPIGPIAQLDDQHAYFRRGDSSRFVLATDLGSIPFLNRTLNTAAMALSRSPSDPPLITRLPTANRYAFQTMVSDDSMLVSVEVIAATKGAGRTRFGTVAPARRGARVDLSDILLLNASAINPTSGVTLESVMPRMLSTTKLVAGSPVAVFWEIYGLRAGEQPVISVISTPEGGGGVLDAINIFNSARAQAASIYTDIIAAGDPIEGRLTTVSLAALRTGIYQLAIKVEVPGEPPVLTSRRIEIIRN